MIQHFYVDLTTLGRGATGVSLYAQRLAAHLEGAFDCRVLTPRYLADRFRAPMVCPDPIFFKRSLVGRPPFWRQRAGVKLGPDSFVYAPHMHGQLHVHSQVITVHDLIWRYYPTRNMVENLFNSKILPLIVRGGVGVITVSEASRVAIARYFRLDERKIVIVGNGLDLDQWKPGEHRHPAGEQEYLLVVSANRPYKNTLELLRNHDLWARRFRLKIVSSMARYGRAIREAVAQSNLDRFVEFHDGISEAALIELYRDCTATVCPSLIEGFDRPALEAMAVGRPVILSDIPAHREIFDGAAIFITPGNRASWEAAFSALDRQDEVMKLTSAGMRVARKFGWDHVGKDLERALLQFEPRLTGLYRRRGV
jgi:glycosyltransferase involved in cell wall biosynthesis